MYYTNWIFIQTMRLFMHSCRLLMLFNLKWFLLSLKLLIGCYIPTPRKPMGYDSLPYGLLDVRI